MTDKPATPAYHRPNLKWQCGRTCLGCACAAGPTAKGECSQTVDPCRPIRNLRSRRAMFIVASVCLTVGLMVVAASGSWWLEFFAPGPLTSPHAQILNRTSSSNRCADCHGAGSQTAFDWVKDMLTCGKHCRTPQTELCLKCHQKQLPAAVAQLPHNRPLEELAAITARRQAAGGATDFLTLVAQRGAAKQQLACADCHKEHHGAKFDLKTMTDRQCQACHQGTFHSFANGHPEFRFDALTRKTGIAFDHVSHATKHYGQAKQTFTCNQCHTDDATGQVKLLANYQQACAACHQTSLKTATSDGVVAVALPTIPVDAVVAAGHTLPAWPNEARGDFDGRLSPILVLLLSADPQAATALQSLSPEFDLAQWDAAQPAHLQRGAQIASALQRLFFELETEGEGALTQRLEQVAGRRLSTTERSQLVAGMPLTLLVALGKQWFGSAPTPAAPAKSDAANETAFMREPTVERGSFTNASWLHATAFRAPTKLIRFAPPQETLLENPLSKRRAETNAGAVTNRPATENSVAEKPVAEKPVATKPSTEKANPSVPAPAPVAAVPPMMTSPTSPPIAASARGETLLENPLARRRTAPDTVTTNAAVAPQVPEEKQPVASQAVEPAPAAIESAPTPVVPTTAVPSLPVTASLPPVPQGWSYDAATFTVRYQPTGHADAWLGAWLELVARRAPAATGEQQPSLVALQTLRQHAAFAACVRCHVTKSADGHESLSWKAQMRSPYTREFTKFSHKPHLLQPSLQDCSHCHQLGSTAGTPHDFLPITKQSCVSCHNATATSQSCTLCHFYHVPHNFGGSDNHSTAAEGR